METLNLNREWHLGSELTAGGFGRIHGAKSETGEDVVIKLIPKMPGGERELLFAGLSGTPNVLPILDTGEWGDFWVLVMPKAAKSLRQHLIDQGGALSLDETVETLLEVTTALAALQNDVVHRDLKPENVLFFDDQWYLADFGIARYAEATTATETWKHAKTWAYAAPEQWRGDRATSATDIYATGIMAFELLTGERPFTGPEEHDFREQHLHEEPPPISGFPAPFIALIVECLFKAPGARPTAGNVHERLRGLSRPTSGAAQRLQQMGQLAVQQKAREEASASAVRSAAEERDALAQIAEQSLGQLLGTLRGRVNELAPQSRASGRHSSSWTFKLLDSELGAGGFTRVTASALDSPGYPAPFEVIAYASIYVQIPTNHWGYEGRSHSLWYCDAEAEGVFRWYETAFMFFPLPGMSGRKNPFALEPGTGAGRTLAPISGTEFQIAWPFTSIDQGQEEEFFERWIGWFAEAAEGTLRQPSTMPERNPRGSWR